MNEDRIAGTARNVGGKVQEGFGRVTGDAKSQADGLVNQAAGAVQDFYGQAKEIGSNHSPLPGPRTRGGKKETHCVAPNQATEWCLRKQTRTIVCVSPWSRRAVGICQPDISQPDICQRDTCRPEPPPAGVAPYAASRRQRQRLAWRPTQPLPL
jgi:uncharacterized protein YjbJ (UPF0337 family)